MGVPKKLQEGLKNYGIDLPVNAKTRVYKEQVKKFKIEEAYIEHLRGLVRDAKKKEQNKAKKFLEEYKKTVEKDENIKKAFLDYKIKKSGIKNKISLWQLKYIKNKLFFMSPTESSFESYLKYRLWNDRADLVGINKLSITAEDIKNFLLFYRVKKFMMSYKTYKIWFSISFSVLEDDEPNNRGIASSVITQLLGSSNNRGITSNAVIIRTDADIDNMFDDIYEKFDKLVNEYKLKVIDIDYIDIHRAKINPLSGSSYKELPDFIKNKKAIINIQNEDNKCFLYSVLCGLEIPKSHPERVSHYINKLNELKYNDDDLPMKLDKIIYFEKRNNLRINVYGLEDKKIFPLFVSYNRYNNEYPLINLLLHDNHYTFVKNFDKLMAKRNDKNKNRVCPICCEFKSNGGDGDKALEKHMSYCISGQKLEIPKKESIKFINFNHMKKCPIRIYGDFEAINDKSNPLYSNNGNSIFETQHKPVSFKILVVSDIPIDGYEKINKYYTYSYVYKGIDSDIVFVKKIQELETYLVDVIQKAQYNYKCNIKIPVLFHNLNYDKNLFFKSLMHYDNIKEMNILPDNTEKYKAFTIGKLNFIDTARFMNSSLESLIKNVDDCDKHFLRHLAKNDEEFKIMKKKAHFPYEWFDNIDKLKTPISNINKEHFNNKLNLTQMSDDDWKQVTNIIKKLNIKTFEEYHDFYLHIDVNGLADVFENFINTSIAYYKLDPCYYVGTPSFAWDAMLLMSGIELELLKDTDMYQFYERGIRGGQSVIFNKYVKANNKYMKDYDKNEKSVYISYLDANNLYGWAMCKQLPYCGFKWGTEMTTDFVQNYEECEDGYTIECDISYPKELHDKHNDYPLAPERLKVGTCQKLCGTFYNKKDYIVDIRNLKLYMSLGLKVDKINRFIQYKQKAWLKPWIDFNTDRRQNSKNDFEKDYFKLMNNAVFGKTMENVRGRVDIKIAFDDEYQKKYMSKPYFKSLINIKNDDKEMAIMQIGKPIVKLDKPIYVGFSILDLSKYHMYDFHYNTMKPKYGNNIELLMTDTDSLVYKVETEDFYKDMYYMKEHFDMSEYDKCNPIYDCSNKKVVGKFKDETPLSTITEFVGVRSKCYAFKKDDNDVSKKLKGITKSVVKKKIDIEDYKKCVLEDFELKENVNSIRTKGLTNYCLCQKKVALSNKDDKRYFRPETDMIKSYAYGHYLIPI